jgi:tRNA nucleotidyltransferase/poly(A) polymerase
MDELRTRILSSPLNAAVFAQADGVFLVGGYVRDLLVRSVHSRDRDFVVSAPPRRLARQVAARFGGTLVELRHERIVRVALPSGVTLDFSRLSEGIQTDLRSRDFTVNALAWSPAHGLLDPTRGQADMKRGIIRCPQEANLRADPLRVLRAYRFSAQFGWRIHPATRALLRRHSTHLDAPASERITLEMSRMLGAGTPDSALRQAVRDGILGTIIPLSNRALEANIKVISNINTKLNHNSYRIYFKEASQGFSGLGLLRLEGLLLGADPARCRLSLSTENRRRVELAGRLFHRFRQAEFSDGETLFDLLEEAREAAGDLLILTGNQDHWDDLRRFRRITRRGRLSAEEIMSATGLRPGPRLGCVLREARRREFAGTLHSGRFLREHRIGH